MSTSQNPLLRKRTLPRDDGLEAQHQHGGKKARLDNNGFGMSKDELDEFGLGDLSEDDEGSSLRKEKTKEEKAAAREQGRIDFEAKKNAWHGKNSKPKKRRATEAAETEKPPKKRKDTPAPEGDVAPKKPRAQVKCRVCGEVGHTRANKAKCPAHNGTWPNGVKPADIVHVDSEADASGEEDGACPDVRLTPAPAATATFAAVGTQAVTSDDDDLPFEDVLSAPVAANNAERAKADEELPSGEASPDGLDYLFTDSSDATSQTSTHSGEQQNGTAPPQQSRKDSGLNAQSAGSRENTEPEVIDLVSDEERPYAIKGVFKKRIVKRPAWIAKLFVNDVEVGRIEGGSECEGIQFMDPKPVVKGFISNYEGYVEGELTIRKSGKAGLRVGGCVPTDSAVKRDPHAKWGDVDVHNLKLERRKPCKEIRVKVLPGKAQVFQDGKLVLESELESEVVKEKIGYQIHDGPSKGDIKTFEDWVAWSDGQLAVGAENILTWPSYPNHPEKGVVMRWCKDHAKNCEYDKYDKDGSYIGACPHEIKRFIEISELARTKDLGDLFQDEINRFCPLRDDLIKITNLQYKAWTEDMQNVLYEQKGPVFQREAKEAREKEVAELVTRIGNGNQEYMFRRRMISATREYIDRLLKAALWIEREREDMKRLAY